MQENEACLFLGQGRIGKVFIEDILFGPRRLSSGFLGVEKQDGGVSGRRTSAPHAGAGGRTGFRFLVSSGLGPQQAFGSILSDLYEQVIFCLFAGSLLNEPLVLRKGYAFLSLGREYASLILVLQPGQQAGTWSTSEQWGFRFEKGGETGAPALLLLKYFLSRVW